MKTRIGKGQTKSKYNNRKVTLDGKTFDSVAEAEYYQALKFQRVHGHIRDFRCQPRYTLLEGFTFNGKKYRAIEYVADFEVTLNDGTVKVIDVKGVQTDVFKLKAKWFVQKMHIPLVLVKKQGKRFVEEVF